jgi:DNA polymerase elongation subunit (family B)
VNSVVRRGGLPRAPETVRDMLVLLLDLGRLGEAVAVVLGRV